MPIGIYNRKIKERHSYICIVCGQVKYAIPSIAKYRKYCSHKCYWSVSKSTKTKNKTSNSMLGQHVGKDNPMYGKYGKDSARFIDRIIQRQDGRWLTWSEKKEKEYIIRDILQKNI